VPRQKKQPLLSEETLRAIAEYKQLNAQLQQEQDPQTIERIGMKLLAAAMQIQMDIDIRSAELLAQIIATMMKQRGEK